MVFSLESEIAKKWLRAADAFGIPKEFYQTEARFIESPQLGGYTFCAIYNPHRDKRPQQPNKVVDCTLCDGLSSASKNPAIKIASIGEYTVIPNRFPATEGMSIAIRTEEQPMYTTGDLTALIDEFPQVLEFANQHGFRVYHNGVGFGASVPHHEHWQLNTFEVATKSVCDNYGFDAAITSRVNIGVSQMHTFPFAHLVFDNHEIDRMASFIRNLGKYMGGAYENNHVPHTLSQGKNGILVVPAKDSMLKGIGAGDVAGIKVFSDRESFETYTYEKAMEKLAERLFMKKELSLTGLI